MESRKRITIMDGEVITFAEGFDERPGAFGPIYQATGPYEVSASRNAVMVHRAELRGPKAVDSIIEAIRQAAAESRAMAQSDRGNFGWRE